MRHARALRRATVILAAVVPMGLGTTTAHADPGIPDVGYGYANNAESVRCVQFFVNNYLDLYLLVDGKFGPQAENGVKQLQKYSTYHWATTLLAVDGIFGKNTGEVVLDRAHQAVSRVDRLHKGRPLRPLVQRRPQLTAVGSPVELDGPSRVPLTRRRSALRHAGRRAAVDRQ
ncbi:hypothetical protein ACFV2H_18520 [Streptomyces sp. NPDC059629]|uniref:hypothetical protein n=1 Tax=Streptomyces sp. NPDC059629 TaxID=3346889 RepID=UPI0036974C4F